MSLKPEQVLQINLINWFKFNYPELSEDLHHFANERKCTVTEGRNLKRMGVSKGVSDIHLALPIDGHAGLWLELKTDKGKVSPEQVNFLYRKSLRGYFAVAVYGLDAAKQVILDYLRNYDSKRFDITQKMTVNS